MVILWGWHLPLTIRVLIKKKKKKKSARFPIFSLPVCFKLVFNNAKTLEIPSPCCKMNGKNIRIIFCVSNFRKTVKSDVKVSEVP